MFQCIPNSIQPPIEDNSLPIRLHLTSIIFPYDNYRQSIGFHSDPTGIPSKLHSLRPSLLLLGRPILIAYLEFAIIGTSIASEPTVPPCAGLPPAHKQQDVGVGGAEASHTVAQLRAPLLKALRRIGVERGTERRELRGVLL